MSSQSFVIPHCVGYVERWDGRLRNSDVDEIGQVGLKKCAARPFILLGAVWVEENARPLPDTL